MRDSNDAVPPTDGSERGRADAYRAIPPVNAVVDSPALTGWLDRVPRSLIVGAAQRVLESYRDQISQRPDQAPKPPVDELAQCVADRLETAERPALASVINATGIIIHTGLGRSPLADSAVAALVDVARNYAPVELDLASGDRGSRAAVVRQLLCDLTGAESATVVNNNAAALMLVLATVAPERSVIVSRGELIEIGGSFRLPEVMKAGGAVLREVGTTNKTRLSDYEAAIDDWTGALMKVHASNYVIEGFTESVSTGELADLAHLHGLPLINDIGSGALTDFGRYGLSAEPDARSAISAGSDLVLFSADKLLGGPQAGIVVGRRELIEKIQKHPMMRAVRVDKLILASLAATLQLHRDPDMAAQRVPVLAMLATPVATLEARARRLVERIQPIDGVCEARVEHTTAYLGGGSLPTQGVPSVAVRLRAATRSEHELAGGLRRATLPVVPRVQDGAVWLELRTIFPDQDEQISGVIQSVIEP